MPIQEHTVQQEQKSIASHKGKRWIAWLLVAIISIALAIPLLHRPAVMAGPFGPPGGPGGAPPGPPGKGGARFLATQSATPVSVAKVESGPMNIYLDALGTVTPLKTVSVYSQASGVLLSVHYREGQMVQKGDLLAEIDSRPILAQLKQAKGALARDQATLQQARLNLKRYQDALKENAIAEQTVSDEQATIQQAEGTVENDEGTVEYDQVQLSYCHITAPISGRIGLRLVDPGNTIFSGSSSTIATITELDPITVVFAIAEDHVSQVREELNKQHGLKVDLYDRSQMVKLTTGKLLTFDNEVDTTTGTVKLRAQFDNGKGSLFPNQFVNARLVVDTKPHATLIPTVAIQYNGQQAFVYVVKSNNTVALMKVSVVGSEQSNSAIEGLKVGDTVVTSNFDRIQEGAAVMFGSGPLAGGMPGPPQ